MEAGATEGGGVEGEAGKAIGGVTEAGRFL